MKEGRKLGTRRKPLVTSFRKCHVLQPKDSSPKRDSKPHNSIGGRLGKQTRLPLHKVAGMTQVVQLHWESGAGTSVSRSPWGLGHDGLVNCVRTGMSISVSFSKTCVAANVIYAHKFAGHDALVSTFVATYE